MKNSNSPGVTRKEKKKRHHKTLAPGIRLLFRDIIFIFNRYTLGHMVDLVHTDKARCKFELVGSVVSKAPQ